VDEVRPARADDLERCGELVASALRHLTSRRGGELLETFGLGGPCEDSPFPVTGEALLSWASGDPDRRVLVGLFERAVVGTAAARIVGSRKGGPDRLGQIVLCYVEPGARQVGVGSALLDEMVLWFRSRRCTHVDGLALPGDRDTKQLYERAGFKARLLVLSRPLD
jgi:GNAT superfamily N-acetyltransferase